LDLYSLNYLGPVFNCENADYHMIFEEC